MKVVVVLLVATNNLNVIAGNSVFSPPAKFERWSHFKDAGVPSVVGSNFGIVSVAEATCRIFANPSLDGYFFYRSLDRSQTVLDTLTSLPSSLQPSHLTLVAEDALKIPCAPGDVPTEGLNFTVSDLGPGLQNW